MDSLKRLCYRTFQFGLDIGSGALYWRKPGLISGVGSRHGMAGLFKALHRLPLFVAVPTTAGHCADVIRRISERA